MVASPVRPGPPTAHAQRVAVGAGVVPRAGPNTRYYSRLMWRPRPRASASVPARLADGAALRGGSARPRAVPDHARAARQRRWRRDADCHDADLDAYMPASALQWPARRWSASRSARATRNGRGGSATRRSSYGGLHGAIGVLLAVAGPWLLPWFVSPQTSTPPMSLRSAGCWCGSPRLPDIRWPESGQRIGVARRG